eukprot:Em0015g146a
MCMRVHGPFIASVTLAAFTCDSVDFPEPPYPDDIVCPDEGSFKYPVTFWMVLSKVRLEAFMWGVGTAIGELPPYFMARAARLSGKEEDEEYEELEAALQSQSKDLLTRARRAVYELVQRVGFFGILLCASVSHTCRGWSVGIRGVEGGDGAVGIRGVEGGDGAVGIRGVEGGDGAVGIRGVEGGDGAVGIRGVEGGDGAVGIRGVEGGDGAVGIRGVDGGEMIPNPLFDLAGITCGHFLVPFWTFFGATVIVGFCSLDLRLYDMLSSIHSTNLHLKRAIPYVGSYVQQPFQEYLEKQKQHLHRKPGVAVAHDSSFLQTMFGYVLLVMVVYFVVSIIHSMAQHHAKRLQHLQETSTTSEYKRKSD